MPRVGPFVFYTQNYQKFYGRSVFLKKERWKKDVI